ALARLGALAVAWYLVAATAAAAASGLLRAGRVATALDVVTLPVVRRIVHAAMGAGLVGATLVAPGARPQATPLPLTAQAGTWASPAPSTSSVDRPPPGEERPVMRRLPVGPGAGPTPPAPRGTASPAPPWEVRPGDHLWSIGERVLTTSWGRAPEDAELAPYWATLVAANRPRLANPADADLIFPGQVLAVPPSPPAPPPRRGR
ncbi:MAG: LysM peptidoglycan-binding domain-containing protein, partial [Acidimicrobiales bacterium]